MGLIGDSFEQIRFAASRVAGKVVKPSDGKQVATDSEIMSLGDVKSTLFDENYSLDDLVGRKGYDIYSQMSRDAAVSRALDEKKFAIVSSDWEVIPATEDKKDTEVADYVRFALDDMRGSVVGATYAILDAIAKGFSANEIIWRNYKAGEHAGKWGVKFLKAQDPAQIEFKFDDFGNVAELWQKQSSGADMKLPMDKFLIYTYRPEYGRVWGRSDLRAAYKHWWSKERLLKMWNMHLETFGSPTRVAKLPTDINSTKRSQMKQVIKDVMTNTAIILPFDIEVEFISATATDGFEKACEYHDKMIHISIMGQTLSGDEGKRSGSLALGRVHEGTKEDFISFLRRDLEEFITEELIRRIVAVNFGPDVLIPDFKFGTREEKISIVSPADAMKLIESGLVQESDYNHLRRKFDLPDSDKYADDSIETLVPNASESVEEIEATEELRAGTVKFQAMEKSEWEPLRKLSRAEERAGGVKFFRSEIAKRDSQEEAQVKKLIPIFAEMRSEITSQVSGGGLTDPRVIENLKISTTTYNKYRKAMTAYLGDIYKERYIDWLKKHAANPRGIPTYKGVKNTLSFGEMSPIQLKIGIEMSPLPPVEALDEIGTWIAEGDYAAAKAARVTMADDLIKSFNRKFWVTDITNDDILKEVKQKITTGMQSGSSQRDTVKAVQSVFDEYGVGGPQNTPARLNTIVRNNTTSAYAQADIAAAQDPEVMEVFPYLEYSAVIDDATTDTCRRLDGTILRADDPAWSWMKPSNHHGCRSQVLSAMAEDAPDGPSKTPDRRIIPVAFGGTE